MSAVTVHLDGPRADIVLRRPDVLNAMNWEVFDGLAAAVDEVAASDADVVVVSGEGRSFSSGIDVTALGEIADDMVGMIARAQAGFRKLAALPLPTVAMLRGHAFGAGLQLGLACDLRVASEDASMGLLEANYGLVPDLIGSTRLPQLVGAGRAKRMIWLAERVDAREAERIGLVEWVVAPDELETATAQLVDRLLAASQTVLRESKKLIDRSHALTVSEGMDAEATAQIACFTAPDFGEKLMAGLQKVRSRT